MYEQIIQGLDAMLGSLSYLEGSEEPLRTVSLVSFLCEKDLYSSLMVNELDEDTGWARKMRRPLQ